jgi:hypothetical protein
MTFFVQGPARSGKKEQILSKVITGTETWVYGYE